MKVILLENIQKLGNIGEVISVKRGYARNFLISKKKALFASKDNIKEVEKIKADLNKKDAEKKKFAKDDKRKKFGKFVQDVERVRSKSKGMRGTHKGKWGTFNKGVFTPDN